MVSGTDKVIADTPATAVMRITLNRPEALNAIDDETRGLLHQELENALADRDVRAIIITGAGKSFSAGGDIRYMQHIDRDAFPAFHGRLLKLCKLIGSADKPIVGVVRGVCAGGALGIALACDQLVASTTTRFLVPFMRIGLTPDMALPYWLARRVGTQMARNIILGNEPVEAERAFALGLCDQIADDAGLESDGLAIASRLAGLAPHALRQTRLLLRNTAVPLDDYLQLERIAAGTCLGGPEFVEGVAAFFEKRQPSWPQASSGD